MPRKRTVLVIALCAVGAALCLVHGSGSGSLAIENGVIGLVFSDGAKGGLVSLVDQATGVDFCSGAVTRPALFALTLVGKSGEEILLSNTDAGSVDSSILNEAGSKTLAVAVHDVGGLGIEVICTVVVREGSSLSEWDIKVTSTSEFKLRSVDFPVLAGVQSVGESPDDDWLLYPFEEGILIPCPGRAVRGRGEWLQACYPSELSMQFMALYDADAGLYVATYDSNGTVKRFGYSEDRSEIRCHVLTLLSEEPRTTYAQPYPAVVGVFHGDWYAAANIYRDWARSQPWCAAGINEKAPGWFLDGMPTLRFDNYDSLPGTSSVQGNSLESVAEKAVTLSRELGTPLNVFLVGWEGHGIWDNPFSMPPRDGYDAFSTMLGLLHSQDNRLVIVRSTTRWADTSPGFVQQGFPDALRDANGKLQYDVLLLSGGLSRRYQMCPSAEPWRGLVVSNASEAARLGVDWLSLDEVPIGSGCVCYASDHDHPPGGGTWWAQETLSLLAEARAAARDLNSDMVCSVESPSEFFLGVADSYVARRSSPDDSLYDWLLAAFPRLELPGAFQYVYNGYIVPWASDRGMFLDRGAYSDMEATPGAYESYVLACLSDALTHSEILSLRCQWASGLGASQENMETAQVCVRVWQSSAREFLVFGQAQRPPEIDVPTTDVQLFGSELVGQTRRMPAVLSGAWTSPYGSVGILFGNISGKTLTIHPSLQGYAVLPTNHVVAQIERNGYPEVALDAELGQVLPVELAPGDLVLVRLVDATRGQSVPADSGVDWQFDEANRTVRFSVCFSGPDIGTSRAASLILGAEGGDGNRWTELAFRAVPSLGPGQTWQVRGQLTPPWDCAGSISLAARLCSEHPAENAAESSGGEEIWRRESVVEASEPAHASATSVEGRQVAQPDWAAVNYAVVFAEPTPEVDEFFVDGTEYPANQGKHLGMPGSDVAGLKLYWSEGALFIRLELETSTLAESSYRYEIHFWATDAPRRCMHVQLDPVTGLASADVVSNGTRHDLPSAAQVIEFRETHVVAYLPAVELPTGDSLGDVAKWDAFLVLTYDLPGTASSESYVLRPLARDVPGLLGR